MLPQPFVALSVLLVNKITLRPLAWTLLEAHKQGPIHMLLVSLLLALPTEAAICHNGCSGHGTCGLLGSWTLILEGQHGP